MAYLVRRAAQSVVAILGALTIVFFLMHLSGDPVLLMLPPDTPRAEIERFRQQLGLDQPLAIQYAGFMFRALQGDMGISLVHRVPAMGLVLDRFPNTAFLASWGLAMAISLAVPLGVLSAVYKNSWIDMLSRVLALVGQCMPPFWLGILLIMAFALWVPLLPPSGPNVVLPGVTLGLYYAAITTRLIRSRMLDVMSQDYIRTARGKGLTEFAVIIRHALRNVALPVVTVLGLQMGALLGGSVITETVFAYPGMGRLVIQAINNRDYPVVQSFVFLAATMIALINFTVDLSYAVLDPRTRRQ